MKIKKTVVTYTRPELNKDTNEYEAKVLTETFYNKSAKFIEKFTANKDNLVVTENTVDCKFSNDDLRKLYEREMSVEV